MYYCVAYDVGNARVRRRMVKWCKQAGLVRLQHSVFAGLAHPGRLRELEDNARAELAATDRFCIIPLDRAAWQNLLLLGSQPGKEALSRSMLARYF